MYKEFDEPLRSSDIEEITSYDQISIVSNRDKAITQNEGREIQTEHIARKDVYLKPSCCFGIGFLLFWALLFFAVVVPLFYRLPVPLITEHKNNGEFIEERAYKTLSKLVDIGPKVVGSTANEVETVSVLMGELAKIRKDLRDYYSLEVNIQKASGAHIYRSQLEVYRDVQNVVVKLAAKNSTSESYLLVNSHFDTVPTSPGAGDDGFMVATMLEVLRVMATSNETLEHPIVFLFNGNREIGMLGSHGFITQHKWATKCKAVINLESAGSGGREFVFQSGPLHPWLIQHYKNSARHPFSSVVAEEIFQSGLIGSFTDLRNFMEYGNIPGLDLAQVVNGYVYHTKYDGIDVIPAGSLQNTGDNILKLVRSLANASELRCAQANETGRAVFFDFLGLFFISYTEETARSLNYRIAVATLILIFVSMSRMCCVSTLGMWHIMKRILILLILQIIALTLALGLPQLVAHVFDSIGLSLTYFSCPPLLIGLYICPALIGLCLPTTIYCLLQQKSKLSCGHHLQMALHSWAIVLAILMVGLTAFGIRSSYIITMPISLYIAFLAISLLTKLHDHGYSWTGLIMAGQVLPFLYISYVFYLFIVVLIPMSGHSGSASNPDSTIALVVALGTVMSFGFLIPLINMFRRTHLIVLILVAVSGLTIFLASSTQIGFPYRVKSNSARVHYQHVRKIYYEYDGAVSRDESGYLFNFQDRREAQPFSEVNLRDLVSIRTDCDKFMMCGVPLFDEHWVKNRLESMWLPREQPIIPPMPTSLVLRARIVHENNTTISLRFRLIGPPHMNLFIQPYEDDFVTISNWTFSQSYLKYFPAHPLSYHICITFGANTQPFDFTLEISKPNRNFNVPLIQLGVSAHYIGAKGDELSAKFASTFPTYAALVEWPSLYQRYIF